MKKIILLATSLFAANTIFAQTPTCNTTSFSDGFSTNSGWFFQTTGAVTVNNGALIFNNAFASVYERAYKSIGSNLPDTYWKAETVYSIPSTNPSGNGAGAVLMGITAGGLDFMTYDASQAYTSTNQDGAAIVLNSMSGSDNNINNWFFMPQGKKGTLRTFDLNSIIYLNSTISTYYLTLERMNTGLLKLSVFTNLAKTIHLQGSPVTFAIDPSITGLNTIQHGGSTPGNSSRLFNGAIDNDFICTNISSVNLNELTVSKSLVVFPNPTQHLLNVDITPLMNESNMASYQIVDGMGKLVKAGELLTSSLNISELPNGIYSIKVTANNTTSIGKFVKL